MTIDPITMAKINELEKTAPVRVNLLDYGVDCAVLLSQGGGTAELTNAQDLYEKVNIPNPIVLVIESEFSDTKVEVAVSKLGYRDHYDQICASVDSYSHGYMGISIRLGRSGGTVHLGTTPGQI